MGKVRSNRGNKTAANNNGEKGRKINKAIAVFRQIACRTAVDKIADTAGNGDRHAYCRGSCNGVAHFYAVIEHERHGNCSSANAHKA